MTPSCTLTSAAGWGWGVENSGLTCAVICISLCFFPALLLDSWVFSKVVEEPLEAT